MKKCSILYLIMAWIRLCLGTDCTCKSVLDDGDVILGPCFWSQLCPVKIRDTAATIIISNSMFDSITLEIDANATLELINSTIINSDVTVKDVSTLKISFSTVKSSSSFHVLQESHLLIENSHILEESAIQVSLSSSLLVKSSVWRNGSLDVFSYSQVTVTDASRLSTVHVDIDYYSDGTLDGGSSISNSYSDYGGAVSLTGISKFTCRGGSTISENKAIKGGAIYATWATFLVLSNCTIRDNEASISAGAIWSMGSSIDMGSGTLFTGNIARNGDGGAILAQLDGFLISSGPINFQNNIAEMSDGGAIYAGDSTFFQFSFGTVEGAGNVAGKHGNFMAIIGSQVSMLDFGIYPQNVLSAGQTVYIENPDLANMIELVLVNSYPKNLIYGQPCNLNIIEGYASYEQIKSIRDIPPITVNVTDVFGSPITISPKNPIFLKAELVTSDHDAQIVGDIIISGTTGVSWNLSFTRLAIERIKANISYAVEIQGLNMVRQKGNEKWPSRNISFDTIGCPKNLFTSNGKCYSVVTLNFSWLSIVASIYWLLLLVVGVWFKEGKTFEGILLFSGLSLIIWSNILFNLSHMVPAFCSVNAWIDMVGFVLVSSIFLHNSFGKRYGLGQMAIPLGFIFIIYTLSWTIISPSIAGNEIEDNLNQTIIVEPCLVRRQGLIGYEVIKIIVLIVAITLNYRFGNTWNLVLFSNWLVSGCLVSLINLAAVTNVEGYNQIKSLSIFCTTLVTFGGTLWHLIRSAGKKPVDDVATVAPQALSTISAMKRETNGQITSIATSNIPRNFHDGL